MDVKIQNYHHLLVFLLFTTLPDQFCRDCHSQVWPHEDDSKMCLLGAGDHSLRAVCPLWPGSPVQMRASMKGVLWACRMPHWEGSIWANIWRNWECEPYRALREVFLLKESPEYKCQEGRVSCFRNRKEANVAGTDRDKGSLERGPWPLQVAWLLIWISEEADNRFWAKEENEVIVKHLKILQYYI